MQKNHKSNKLFISIALIWAIGILTIASSNPALNGLGSDLKNEYKLCLQNSNNSHSTTVSATQIYFSYGNITNQTIIESGINGKDSCYL
ncbi:hypothetical protein [Candidatus Nitrosocosmicus arcticus]|uniref:Uncharacterized protein n=1 Tax=Candidatus Nitrosocosmicus arcticus TaxID=2035267 RepID=A0A557SWE5_9ARCH|nr:hypothetical protein [Candidatus Nitrosocosmicus arcticus]TVP40920.1 hypothetical protein NARC_50101 [Candidatus Nitrosocosmicus arcticus]